VGGDGKEKGILRISQSEIRVTGIGYYGEKPRREKSKKSEKSKEMRRRRERSL